MPATLTPEQAQKINLHCQQNPSFFFEHFLGSTPWPYQVQIAEAVRDNRLTSIASCHAIGKSWVAARIACWFLVTHPGSIVVTTAPTWRQVKDILWREIRTAYENAKVPLTPDEPNMTGWEIRNNWFAVGLSTTEPDKFVGYHADSGYLLTIGDESSGIDEPIWEAVDAISTGSRCKILRIGNPTSSSGTFRDDFRNDRTGFKLHISAFDTPNFIANGIDSEQALIDAIESKRPLETPAPYLIDPVWVYETGIKKWGIESPMYQARILGQFPSMSSDTLIPLNWIEAAMEPERHLKVEKGAPVYGIDVARFGDDRTVIAPRLGDVVQPLQSYHMQDTMQTAERVWAMLVNDPLAKANVDVIGLGAGVVDRLKQFQKKEELNTGKRHWTRVLAVNVGEKPDEDYAKKTGLIFANKRAELYWRLREKFEQGTIALPNDDELANELSLIKYKFNPDGKLIIEEKAEIKKRLLKSPDKADAVMLSYASSNAGKFVMDAGISSDEFIENQPYTSGLMDRKF